MIATRPAAMLATAICPAKRIANDNRRGGVPALIGFAIACLLLSRPCTASAQQHQAPERTIPLTIEALDLDITLDYDDRTLKGSAILTVNNITHGLVTHVPLQVGRLMKVTEATQNGNALHYTQAVVRFEDWPTRQMNQVSIRLAAPLRPGRVTRIAVKWNGTVTPYTETGMSYVKERIDSAFTLLRSETGAFPVLGVPSLSAIQKAPFRQRDFTFHVRVTVPAYEVVALGGKLVSRQTSGSTTTYEYASTAPAPFVNIAVAPYAALEHDGVRVYYLPGDSAGGVRLLDAATRGITLLTSWFGPIADKPATAIIEIPSGYGSQASVRSGIIQDAAAFQDKTQLRQLYHELSHFWNAPSRDEPSPRWEEGLASFLEYLMADKLDSTVNAQAANQTFAPRLVARFGGDSTNLGVALVDYGRANKTNLSYPVGRLLFAVLYETLGEADFNRLVGGFYQQYHVSGATTRQFVEYAKTRSPYDLSDLFDDWVFTTRWYERLRSGETIARLAADYRKTRM